MKKVIVISGATATGKTDRSIDLAEKNDGVIVNFDSLLFYKELSIGTAKPSIEEMRNVKHHLVGAQSIKDPINAADFVRQAIPIIENIHLENKNVFLVGGSGFYLRALLHGMYDSPTTPTEILERSQKLYDQEGIDPFITLLDDCDPESASSLHANDHYRVRRAVEHFWSTSSKFSDSKKSQAKSQSNKENNIHGWDLLHIYLAIPKEEHWQIMLKRTQKMIKNGLLDEVRTLLANGFSGQLSPLQSIGYKESIAFLQEEIKTEKELIERIYIATRRLAKAQKTWFNKDDSKTTFNPLTDNVEICNAVEKMIEKTTS